MTNLQKALIALGAKQQSYTDYWNYYEGKHDLKYSTKKLEDYFRKEFKVRFSQNFCAVVVDSALDRVKLATLAVAENPEATKKLNDLWKRTEMNLDSLDVNKAALVCGESFVIVQMGDEVEAYYNDPRNCHVFYDPAHPRKKLFGARWWDDYDKDKRYVTLYYSDRYEWFESREGLKTLNASIETPLKAEAFQRRSDRMGLDARHKIGEVPMYRFVNERRAPISVLANAIDIQDAINKLINDMMIGADYSAMRQRYIIAQADPGDFENGANKIWIIPQGGAEEHPSEVGEFGEIDLKNFLNAIEQQAQTLAIITRTPKHYFLMQAGDPSGEALMTMESPLVKKCEDITARLTPEYRSLAAVMARLSGLDVKPEAIEPIFVNPQTVQPRTEAEVLEINIRAGIPLVNQLRDKGWSEEEIKELQQDQADEDKRNVKKQADLAAAAMTDFNSGGGARE